MDAAEIRAGLVEVLKGVAAGFDESRLDPARPLREQVDLDSMDWLNVVALVQERLRVDIPEADYPRLTTLDAVVAYLAARLAGSR